MRLTTISHTGRRVSYQALVRVRVTVDPQFGTVATVRDETGLWDAVVTLDDRLAHRMGGDQEAFFWARMRGGDIDLKDREINPEWEEEE